VEQKESKKMRFKKKLAVSCILSSVFILLLSTISINAQIIQWAQTYGGPGDDGGESMVLTSDGGIVIAGFKNSNNSKNVLIMKTDSSGNEIWSRTYNLGLDDWGRSLKQTQDGGFIIAGFTEVVPQIHDPFLIKTDSAGNIQWQHQYDYGFGDDDRGHAVWQTSDGGYIIAGQTWLGSPTFGTYDMYVVKTDMAGNVQWRQTYAYNNAASPGADVALAVQQLSDGGYIIGGFTQSTSWASYIIRTDSLGNAIWSNIYPGSWQSECYDIQATPDGGFILTGTESSFTTDGDLLIIKLDANGNLIWKKIYGTVDIEKGESIQRLQDGGYIIAGMSTHGAGGYDMYVVRTNSTGDSLWSRTIGGFGDDRAFSVATTQDGSHLVTGWTWSYGQGLGDVYLVKLLESVVPVELTGFTANTNGNDVIINWSTATELNNSGFEVEKKSENENWCTIGFIQGSGTTQQNHIYSFTDYSVTLGKYSYRLKQVDYDGSYEYSYIIEVEMNSIPTQFSLEQNYPNPFNPSTTIKYSLPEAGKITLKLYDILGNEIAVLEEGFKERGNYNISFNADLASGIYLYRLQHSRGVITKKMVLLK